MKNQTISAEQINAYIKHLRAEERSVGTIDKYRRDLRSFAAWLEGRDVSKELAAAWKGHLQDAGYRPVTINSMLAAVNGLFRFLGWENCRVKFLKIQRRTFRDQDRELSRAEYERLVDTAKRSGKDRLALLLETICGTGIRVSEVRYITVEAAKAGRAEVAMKGKIRTILIPGKLCRKLLNYAKRKKIAAGEIFRTASGKSLSRRQIWSEMKTLCKQAKVDSRKVFPHNLRHLFAVTYYNSCKDVVKLADVLGHSSIETTRIYLLTTGVEHAKLLDRLGLVS